MRDVVQKALALWDLQGAAVRLAAERENHVYFIRHAGGEFALRLHRAAYRTDQELLSELDWMDALKRRGIKVPVPVRSREDQFLHQIDNVQVDVLTWLDGEAFVTAGQSTETLVAHYCLLGQALARLHNACDDWVPEPGFQRPDWNISGLCGAAPLWGAFWDNPTLTDDERELFLSLRENAKSVLGQTTLDYGLIHADPVRENVLVQGKSIRFIDFDDGGSGYRLFDIATALVKIIDNVDFAKVQAALLKGYRSERAIDATLLDLFLALRAATYVGWIVPRMTEPGSTARNRRFIDHACRLSRAALNTPA